MPLLSPQPVQEQRIAGLTAIDLFAAADRAQAAGQVEETLKIYDALSRDPDSDIRAEARFRKGKLLARLKRYAEAATAYRAVLDEKPNAAGVRLELARVLALMGDEAGARRAARQAQVSGLPPDVALSVQQFANALRSPKTFGGAFELALAPDSNINRATAARTLDTVIAPLTLSKDARARSAVGASLTGQIYARIRLSDRLSVVPRAASLANLYTQSSFDDVSASTLLGVEWQHGRSQLVPSIGTTWRWYGQQLYARTQTLNLDATRAVTKRSQLTLRASASRARYVANALQNGAIYDVHVGYEQALTPTSGVGASIGVSRQTAADPGYATISGDFTSFAWVDVRHITFFGSTTLRRTEGDARLFLFPDRRREWFFSAAGGATFRQLKVRGFAPFVRLAFERNRSSVGLYDYRRLAANFGITRAF
jgi:tetratricopeptide (TPR) repeat protein